MRGVGKTVFSGNRIEEFQVEVLGVLENLGPKQSVILARLSGGPLARTGVLQGMSGSPVYFDGKLAGAVALGFSFSTEPIAGIRPIAEMLRLADRPIADEKQMTAGLARVPARQELVLGEGKLMEIATPVSFSGVSSGTLAHFAPELRALGLDPRQGVSSGGKLPPALGDPAEIRPGSMITVQLLSGDMSLGADGTVTQVEGKQIYAFGHRFLSVGSTDLPFARANVLALLPNLSSSFKISSAREWMGSITQDRNTALVGELGKRASTIPFTINVSEMGRAPVHYAMQVVHDRVLSPFLVQMALFSALETSERTLGPATYSLRGTIDFQGGEPPLVLDNLFAGDYTVPLQASIAVSTPLVSLLGSGFESLRIKDIQLSLDAIEKKRQLQLTDAIASRREVRPGESFEVSVLLAGDQGSQVQRTLRIPIPIGTPAGPVQISVVDATARNLQEYQRMATGSARSAAQLIGWLNGYLRNDRLAVGLYRNDGSFQMAGEEFPNPPASLSLVLAKAQSNGAALAAARPSRVAEWILDFPGYAVTGSKIVQVDVKE